MYIKIVYLKPDINIGIISSRSSRIGFVLKMLHKFLAPTPHQAIDLVWRTLLSGKPISISGNFKVNVNKYTRGFLCSSIKNLEEQAVRIFRLKKVISCDVTYVRHF